MATEKFYTDDMHLAALLDGRWEEKKEKVVFDPIYGPTPFKPHAVGEIVALFERQTCARCSEFNHAYLGVFEEHVSKDGTVNYKSVNAALYIPTSKGESQTSIPACFRCL